MSTNDRADTVAHCTQPWTNLFIRFTGKIQPCCQNTADLGNVGEVALTDAWNHPEMARIRTLVATRQYDAAGCRKSCPLRTAIPQAIAPEQLADGAWETAGQDFRSNVERAVAAIKEGAQTVQHQPLYVDIQPNLSCNQRCFMCWQDHSDKRRLNIPQLAAVCGQLGLTRILRFQGGEVFANREFGNFLGALATPRYQKVVVITNGTLLDPSFVERILTQGQQVHFMLSIDSLVAERFATIRGTDSFSEAFANLEYLARRQRETGTSLVQWNFVLMRSNFEELPQILDKAIELGVDLHVSPLQGVFPTENLFSDRSLQPSNARQILAAAAERADRASIKITGLPAIHELLQLPRDCMPA